MVAARNFIFLSGLALVILITCSCSRERAELGSPDNPVKLFFVPSVDAKVINNRSREIEQFLEANTPYAVEVSVPTSYVAVVEAFGSKRADVAALNTFGYILANEKYGASSQRSIRILRRL